MNASTSLNAHGFVRVAACSPELRLGDVAFNVQETIQAARSLSRQGAQVIVFPELGLTGYSCGDLFMNAGFRQQAVTGLQTLVRELAKVPALVIVGMPLAVNDRLYNVAAVLCKGELLGFVPKSHLPNSWEFYERRWFSPAVTLTTEFAWCGELGAPIGTDLIFHATDLPECRVAVEICEDLWTVQPPSGAAALHGATVIANLSASDELLGKAEYRRQLVAQQAGRCHAAYIYSASGPGESSTDLVFSGHSLIAENGALLTESKRFQFEITSILADVDVQRLQQERLHSSSFRDDCREAACGAAWRRIEWTLGKSPVVKKAADLQRHVTPHPFVPSAKADRSAVCEEIFAIQATGLARRVRAVGAKTLVLGLSGGLDSTLALLVCQEALARAGVKGASILTITMPGMGTTDRTRDNAVELAAALGVKLRTISIKSSVTQHLKDIDHGGAPDITFENAQARERTQVLMDVANQTGGIVVGTGDLSEAALGWCTFNGDHMSMYHVNAGVPKTLVRYLIEWCATQPLFARASGVLTDILDTPISPELLPADASGGIAQKTEDSVGPYELVDFFLFYLVRHGCSAEKITFLARLAFEGQYTAAKIDHWLARFLGRFRTQQFKRSSMPDGPKVGSVALSPRGDWRMPSDLGGGF